MLSLHEMQRMQSNSQDYWCLLTKSWPRGTGEASKRPVGLGSLSSLLGTGAEGCGQKVNDQKEGQVSWVGRPRTPACRPPQELQV